MTRLLAFLLPMLLAGAGGQAAAATAGAGRHWEIAIESLGCEPAGQIVTVGARIRYLGSRGVVEAPLVRIVDGGGKAHPPRGVVWTGGGKELVAWLAAGGMTNVQSAYAGTLQFKFALADLAPDLRLEFGDVPAIALTRAGAAGKGGFCGGLLDPARIQVARRPPPARAEGTARPIHVYRDGYPCLPAGTGAPRRVEAASPPYLPELLLVFGRGFLPNAREIALPMGTVPAQSYAYAGPDQLEGFEEAARRALRADFPALAAGLAPAAGRPTAFAFNWGLQRAASGNELQSIGLYRLRPCAN
jgi:hypothetical protein